MHLPSHPSCVANQFLCVVKRSNGGDRPRYATLTESLGVDVKTGCVRPGAVRNESSTPSRPLEWVNDAVVAPRLVQGYCDVGRVCWHV